MTLPQAKRAVRTWWVPAAIAFLMVVIVVNYMLLIPSLHRQRDQAHAGQLARQRQRVIYPMILKVVKDARHRGVITADDLCRFRTGRRCQNP
jgi:hypothetical protein